MEEKFFVYELVHSGKRVYVGMTSNPDRRLAEHVKVSNLIPRPFTMRVMCACERVEDALELEAALQDSSGVQYACKGDVEGRKPYYRDINRGTLRRTRQVFVERLLGEGKSHEEIAGVVGISLRRVKSYVSKIPVSL